MNTYIPSDKVNVTWTIDLSKTESTSIDDARLRIYYPKDSDMSKYMSYRIVPNLSTDTNRIYHGSKNILLDKTYSNPAAGNSRTYNVEIYASGTNSSLSMFDNKVNQTHITEIHINEPATLKIHKTVPDGRTEELSGWMFKITGPDGVDDVIPIKPTDNDGNTMVEGLRPGTYRIEEIQKNDGWRKIAPVDVTLSPGEEYPMEFANTPNILTITKHDTVGNPLRDWSFTVQGPEKEYATTDDSGVAVVRGLPSGTYAINEEPKDGWRLVSIEPETVEFAEGESKSVNVINAQTGTLTIYKRDSEGHPLAGWTFDIQGPDNERATTDDSGVAIVKGLLPGEYEVTEELKAGWVNVTSSTQRVVLAPGEDKTLEPFINAPIVDLTITEFSDANKNGVLDRDNSGMPIEMGTSGWKYTITEPNGAKINSNPTNGNGVTAVQLLPGTYTVAEILRDGCICTTQNPRTVTVTSLGAAVEFGNKAPSLIPTKFNDSNLNGKHDAGEEGIPGWTFTVVGPNGFRTETVPTDKDGRTVVEVQNAGSYTVTETSKDGWINTTSDVQSVKIGAGEDKELYFGNIKTGSIEITKFNDTNRDGIRDQGEEGLAGWIFSVEGPDGSTKETATTNGNGTIALSGLYPGEYTITETSQDRWRSSTPSTVKIALSFGENEQVSFGNFYCQRCEPITDQERTGTNYNEDINVSKSVSSISAQDLNTNSGSIVNYTIQVCTSRQLENIGSVPTDIVIAVDNSPSISNLNKSAISQVQNLVAHIKENDLTKVTRVGLVSWSDRNLSKVQADLTNDYDKIITGAGRINFPEGEQTDYQQGIDLSLKAFQAANQSAGRIKKIVIITDASDSGYIKPSKIPGQDYVIYAIVVGENSTSTAYKMLKSLTDQHHGYIASITGLSELEGALAQVATAGTAIKDVKLVETLPNYLVLLNSTATDDGGKVRLNGESREWSTTSIVWDVGDLSGCWNTTFQAAFCWKLPADVNQPGLKSYINYTDDTGARKTLQLPEYEINIVPNIATSQETESSRGGIVATETKKQPGFEGLLAVIGLFAAGGLYRRRNN